MDASFCIDVVSDFMDEVITNIADKRECAGDVVITIPADNSVIKELAKMDPVDELKRGEVMFARMILYSISCDESRTFQIKSSAAGVEDEDETDESPTV